jgi:hypothetical protein
MAILLQWLACERRLIREMQNETLLIRDRLLTCACHSDPSVKEEEESQRFFVVRLRQTPRNDTNKQPLIPELTFPLALEKRPPSWGRAGSR